jgi:ABC-type sulfate transport system substrate-binding protein
MKKLSQKERMDVTLRMFGDMHKELRKSNPTAKEVRAANIKVVVASPEWQKIRHAFIGTWQDTPEENVKVMRDYIGNMNDPIKVRQVLNYVTSSGFRIGIISHPSISKFREEVREAWANLIEKDK